MNLTEQVQVSEAAKLYLDAQLDPFTAEPCGIPEYPSVRTQKFRVFIRGTFNTGTTGVGFAQFAPRACVANDVACMYSSTSTYSSVATAISGAGVTIDYSNAPFVSGSFSASSTSLQWRVVSAGLRVRYAGTELNRGGKIIGFSQPDHITTNILDESTMLKDETARKYAVKRKWTTALWQVVHPQEADFTSTAGVQAPHLAFLVVAADAATSVAYDFEAVAIVEYAGHLALGKTMTQPDIIGYTAVQAVLPAQGLINRSAEKAKERGYSNFMKYLEMGVSGIVHVAPKIAQAAALALPGSRGVALGALAAARIAKPLMLGMK